jgi:hypothetical protein
VAALPTCRSPRSAFSVKQVSVGHDALVDQEIAIRAPLDMVVHGTTLADCPHGCCNVVWSEVGLTFGVNSERFVLRFWNHLDRGRFACAGDDSTVCCGVPIDGRTVRSTGVLRSIEATRDPIGLPAGWYLDDAEVCVEP